MLTREQTEFFLVKAYNAALRAGARILDIYNDGVDIEVNLKSDRTPITPVSYTHLTLPTNSRV